MVKKLLFLTSVLGAIAGAFASIDVSKLYRIVIAGGRNGCYNYLSTQGCGGWRIVDSWYQDDFSGNQHWTLKPVNGTTDVYNIIAVGRPSCDNMLSCNDCSDNQVNLWNIDDGSGRQQWKLTSVPGMNDTYTVSLTGGRDGCNTYLSLPSCSGSNNTATLQASDGGSGLQRWIFSPVGAEVSTPLEPFKFAPLNIGEIKPMGWLLNQAEIQANGLAGHLYDFYNYVKSSPWVGGESDYSDLHEAGPYWLNGLVPLAFQLKDERLLGQVNDYVFYIIDHQAENGWIGPDDQYVLWPRFPALLALMQYAQANSSATETVVNTMHKFLNLANDMLSNNTGFEDWGRARWCDLAISVMWLLDEYPNGNEDILVNILKQIKTQGDDWRLWFSPAQFPTGDPGIYTIMSHGVNNGQALKSEAVAYRFTHDAEDLAQTKVRVDLINKYHGRPSGIFGCDEHLAGPVPSRGSELCTVVETSYSYMYMYMVAGDNTYADYAERLIFNALPAELTEDMWAHQYLQQYNQIAAKNMPTNFWNTDGSYSNVFGLEPNYPCCTVNHPQGWPKYIAHMFFTINEKADLVAGLLGPASVDTTLANDNVVSVIADTLYPFNSTLQYTIQARKSFNFGVRIPSWATTIKYSVNSGHAKSGSPNSQSLILFPIKSGTTTITVTIPMTTRTQQGHNGATAVYHGPLAYALPLNYSTTVLAVNPEQSKDYEFDATNTWQIAIDPTSLKYNGDANIVPQVPFSTENATVSISASICTIEWSTAYNSNAAAPPNSPASCNGSTRTAELLPFGATRLRIGEMPSFIGSSSKKKPSDVKTNN